MEPSVEASHREVLEAFDAPGRKAASGGPLNLTQIAHVGGLHGLAEMREVAAELVARGWLRPAGEPEAYTRTEDGRLAIAGALDVTLYTRPGCHLCDEAKAQIAPLLARVGARLREVNVDADPELRERYNVDVPVILLGARKVAKHRVNLEQFRRQLEEARQTVDQIPDLRG